MKAFKSIELHGIIAISFGRKQAILISRKKHKYKDGFSKATASIST